MKNISPIQVLIIDDNPEFVKNFKNLILETGGQAIEKVDCAYNGNDGLLMLRDHSYNYVFMDIDMPGIDGISATRFANFEYHHTNTQIIAISFHTENTFRNQMLRAGASKYLAKDEIEVDQLAEIFEIQ